jgi:hypothetical protein
LETLKEKYMRRLMTIAAAAASIVGSAEFGNNAQAASFPNASLGVAAIAALPLEKVQYYWGGYNYCWYGNGWRGPGWYWCGYPWRYGYGWGGGLRLERLGWRLARRWLARWRLAWGWLAR